MQQRSQIATFLMDNCRSITQFTADYGVKMPRSCDAEGHLQIWRRMIPHARFEVVFDLPVRQYIPGKNT
ncbi:hypothetical protein [Microseira wollei]|uniref:hypothetical protein n=1 Tax=Microseira wollei TaxID=467598 RepID=UPI001CFEE3C6|nr:hypothetical protein [Microseira wollei]